MFYVYVYRDPRPEMNAQAVYVGKGCGARSTQHWVKGNTRNKQFNEWLTLIRRLSLEPIIQTVAKFKDETKAFKKEIELIEIYGRRNLRTGTLFNLTTGGEGFAGIIRTEEWRSNMSAAMSTPEQVSRNSSASLKRWMDPGYRNKVTVATRAALSKPEIAEKCRAAKLISHRTPEFREKMTAVGKGFWDDPDYRQRTTAAQRAAAVRPDVLAKKAAATKAAWADPVAHAARAAAIKASRTPELRAQLSASCSALWDDDRRAEQSAKMKAVLASPEAKAQRTAAMKKRWADPVMRAKLLAARKNKASPP